MAMRHTGLGPAACIIVLVLAGIGTVESAPPVTVPARAGGATVQLWGASEAFNHATTTGDAPIDGCLATAPDPCALFCGALTDLGDITTVYVTSHGLDQDKKPSTQAACYGHQRLIGSMPQPVTPWPMPDASVARWQVASTAFNDKTPEFPLSHIWYFAVGGIGPTCTGPQGTCDTVERFDFFLNQWSLLPPLPVPVAAASVSYEQYENGDYNLLVFGGRQCATMGACAPLGILQIYDGQANQWLPPVPMPPISDAAALGDCDHTYAPPFPKLFLFGGDAGPGVGTSDKAWEVECVPCVDPASGTASTTGTSYEASAPGCPGIVFHPLPPMPTPASNAIAMVGRDAPVLPVGASWTLCVVGGLNAGTALDQVQRYDYTAGAWIASYSDPLARHSLSQSGTGWHPWMNDGFGFRIDGPYDPLAMVNPCFRNL